MILRLNFDDDGALLCPYCKSNKIHHWVVEMVDREIDAEDAVKTFLHLGKWGPFRSRREGPVISNDKSEYLGNPSPREHGTTVIFICGDCGKQPHLQIAEDEGRSIVKWMPTNADRKAQTEADAN